MYQRFGGITMKYFRIALACVIFAFSALTVSAQEQNSAQSSATTPEADPVSSLNEEIIKSRLELGTDRWMQMHFFLQSGFSSAKTWDAENGEKEKNARWSKDFYIQACRLILNGQLSQRTFFFAQTEDLQAGKSSSDGLSDENSADGQNHMYMQDAYVKFAPSKMFQIYTGLLAVPSSLQNLISQATLLGVTPLPIFKTAPGYSNNGRDTGFVIRGLIVPKKPILDYRLGVFRGLGREVTVVDGKTKDVRNKNDLPRITARVQFNGGEPEEGYFLSENYIGKRKILALGFAADYQPDQHEVTKDYLAFSFDLDVDMPFTGSGTPAIAGQIGFIHGSNCPDTTGSSVDSFSSFYVQAGYLLNPSFQCFGKYFFTKSKGDESSSAKTLAAGMTYFINEHFSNVKFQFDVPVGSNRDDADQYKATLQFQGYM